MLPLGVEYMVSIDIIVGSNPRGMYVCEFFSKASKMDGI
jgi:hypothetical protein